MSVNIKRLLKDCFWEYNFDSNDIMEIVNGDDWNKKVFLFEKILLNSTKMINDLKIFDKDDLHRLINEYKVPRFNYKFAFKRKNIAEVYFLGKKVLVNELKWVA